MTETVLQDLGEHEEQSAVGHYALRWLQIDPTPRLIVDPSLWLVWRNAAAERLLLESPDLDVRDSQLAAEDRQGNVALAELVASAADEVSTCTLSCRDGDGHLLILARLLPVDEGHIALCVQRTGSAHRSSYADFSGAFGLTTAEAQIANMLISGQTADSIAEARANSVGTVRSHIRSIYHKLDVSSREMMFHRLQPFRIV